MYRTTLTLHLRHVHNVEKTDNVNLDKFVVVRNKKKEEDKKKTSDNWASVKCPQCDRLFYKKSSMEVSAASPYLTHMYHTSLL